MRNTARLPLLLAGFALFLAGDGLSRRHESRTLQPHGNMLFAKKHFREQPLRFEENRGQAAKETSFVARRAGMTLLLGSDGATLAMNKGGKPTRLKLEVEGARQVDPVADAKLPTKTNYLIGRDRANWRTGIPTYAKVTYPSIREGVDLVYHGEGGQLEYDFVVAPGANPADVAMNIEGSDGLTLTESGALRIAVPGGEVIQQRPRVYQRDANGKEHDVVASYRLRGKSVGFEVASYDRTRPLVIDPELGFSTFLGGMGSDQVNGIAVDSGGAAYVTGKTQSDDIQGTRIGPRAIQPGAATQSADAFVAKLSTGGQLMYFTYIVGSNYDEGRGIAVDGNGVAYVAGETTSPDFPITQGNMDVRGSTDSFALAVNSSGNGLNFASYLDIGGRTICAPQVCPPFPTCIGMPGCLCVPVGDDDDSVPPPNTQGGNPCTVEVADDYATSIALFGSNIYVGGRTSSGQSVITSVPNGPNGPIPPPPPTSGAYVASFPIPTAGAAPVITSKILGGNDNEGGGVTNGIAVDAGGVYAVGTAANPMPEVINESVPGYQIMRSGIGRDAFVVKLANGTFNPLYGTFLGGEYDEEGNGIALGANGQAYVTGATSSYRYTAGNIALFPTVNAFQPENASDTYDAFVTHINTNAPGASSLVFSTHLGGTGEDYGQSISVDPLGQAYVVGYTRSNNFPNTPFTPRTDSPINDEAFLTELAPGGRTLVYSAYLGGSFEDRALAIAVTTNGVYVGGYTSLSIQLDGVTGTPRAFPITPGVAQTTFGGGSRDGFVLRIGFEPLKITPGQAILRSGQTQQFTAEGGVGAGYYFIAGGASGGTVVPQTGLYTAGPRAGSDIVTVYDAAGNTASAGVIVTTAAEPPVGELQLNPTLSAIAPRGSVAFTATEGRPPYVFDISGNGSGGSIGPNDGRYTAGPRGGVVDTVRVTDSLGQIKTASVQVGAGITISPQSPQVARGGTLQLNATGGTGGPYTWSASLGTITSGGAFTAPTSSVVVSVQARDALGNVGTTSVSVGGAVAISPTDPTTFPNGTIGFTAFGGSGTGYHWAVLTSPSTGGNIDVSSGVFTAGATGNVQETIQVADSNNNRAATTINVGPGLTISANTLNVPARGQVALSAAGGSGSGYTFTIESSPSGGSVTSGGVYTAGTAGGVDVIRVTDSAGNTATITITAEPAPPGTAPPGPPGVPGGTSGGTSGGTTPGGNPAPIGNGRIEVGGGDGGDDCHVAVVGTSSRTTNTSVLALMVVGLGIIVRRRRRAA